MDRPEGMSEAEIKAWCTSLKCKHLKSATQRTFERYGSGIIAGIFLFFISLFASYAFLFGSANPYQCLVVFVSANGSETCGGIASLLPSFLQTLIALAVLVYSIGIGATTFYGLSRQDKDELAREKIHLAWLDKMRANYKKHHH